MTIKEREVLENALAMIRELSRYKSDSETQQNINLGYQLAGDILYDALDRLEVEEC